MPQRKDIQGQLQLALGHSVAALKTWQQAADNYENIGDRDGKARSQINQAQAMRDLGLYPRACKTLLEALELDDRDCEISEKELQTLKEQPQETRNFASVQLLGLRSLGNVLQIIGSPEQSQMVLLKSWQLAQQLGDRQNIAAIYLSLGNTARTLGNRKSQHRTQQQPMTLTQSVDCIQGAGFAEAVEFYQQAATCYRQAESSTSPRTRIQAQLNLLSLLVQTQQLERYRSNFDCGSQPSSSPGRQAIRSLRSRLFRRSVPTDGKIGRGSTIYRTCLAADIRF